jgi:hypothetical protein
MEQNTPIMCDLVAVAHLAVSGVSDLSNKILKLHSAHYMLCIGSFFKKKKLCCSFFFNFPETTKGNQARPETTANSKSSIHHACPNYKDNPTQPSNFRVAF